MRPCIVRGGGHGGIENFQSFEIQGVEGFLADAGAPRVKRMRGNPDGSGVANGSKHGFRRLAFELGKSGADAEQMSLRGAHFDTRHNQEPVWNSCLGQIGVGFTGVVVGDCDAGEPACDGGPDHCLGRAAPVRGIVRVRVKVESMQHAAGPLLTDAGEKANSKAMQAALKEWAVVCAALESGAQSILLRKGGIAEGRQGFTYKHHEFVLFPTWFHGQIEKTSLPAGAFLPFQRQGEVEIRIAATLEWTRTITDWRVVERLPPFHILSENVLRERFSYDTDKALYIAFLRVYRIEPALVLPDQKCFGGCRSWIDLPAAGPFVRHPVLNDGDHARRGALLESILAGGSISNPTS